MGSYKFVYEDYNKVSVQVTESYTEILIDGSCQSFDCFNFRTDSCRMKEFIRNIESKDFRVSVFWNTPSHHYTHIVKNCADPYGNLTEMLNEFKTLSQTPGETINDNCDFTKKMINIHKKAVSQ